MAGKKKAPGRRGRRVGWQPHLRGPGPHTRECWAVDLLLGKE